MESPARISRRLPSSRALGRLAIFVAVLAAGLAIIPNAYALRSAIAIGPVSATADPRATLGGTDTGGISDVAATTTDTTSGAIDNLVTTIDSGGPASSTSRSTATATLLGAVDMASTGADSHSTALTSDATDGIDTTLGTPSAAADADIGAASGAIDNPPVNAPSGHRPARLGHPVAGGGRDDRVDQPVAGGGRLNRQRGRVADPPVPEPVAIGTDPGDPVITPVAEAPADGTEPVADTLVADTHGNGTAQSQPLTAPSTLSDDSATAPVAETDVTAVVPVAAISTPEPIVSLPQIASAPSAPMSTAPSELPLAAHAPGTVRRTPLAAGSPNGHSHVARASGPSLLAPSLVAPGHGVHAGAAVADAGQPAPGVRTGLSGAPGGSSGGGFSPSLFLAIVVALAGLARLLFERLRLPSVIWRPVAFVSLLERPG